MKRLLACLMVLMLLCPAALGESFQVSVPPEASYFDDALFIGDSVGNQLRRFNLDQRKEGNDILGDAQFLTAGAFSVYLASLGSVEKDKPALHYRGRAVTVREGVSALAPGKVFIMLGLADEPGRNVERDITRYRKVINHIRAVSPDIKIVSMSVTPVTQRAEGVKLKQASINLFNQHLEALCKEEGIDFVDVAGWLKNDDGFLTGHYSNDKKVHLNQQGLKLMVQALYYYAAEQMEAEARLADAAGK